jgi:hypothetical protein
MASMNRTLSTMLVVLCVTGCRQASPAWEDPTRARAPAPASRDQLRHEQFYGRWSVVESETERLNGTSRLADRLAAGVEFQRNGVVLLERSADRRAGTWRPIGADQILMTAPSGVAPVYYQAEFRDSMLLMRNRQTGEWLALRRRAPAAINAPAPAD